MESDEKYYNDLISAGYSSDDALKFTTQYYPEFTGGGKTRSIADSHESVNELAKAIISIMENQSEVQQNKEDTLSDEKSTGNENPLVNSIVNIFATIWVWISESFYRVKNDERLLISISGFLVLAALTVFAFSIPETPESIEGSWTKSDDGQVIFSEDGRFDDGFQRQSYWILESGTLSITSTGEWMTQNGTDSTYTIEQDIRLQFSDDKMLMWMKWDSIKLDGEIQDLPGDCIGLVRSSSISNHANFDVSSHIQSYDEQKPSWCD